MQKDGGVSSWHGQAGFMLTPWRGVPLCVASQCSSPLPADAFPEAPCHPPQEPATTRGLYAELFRTYTSWLGDGGLDKVVLARTHDEPVPPDFSPAAAFRTACRLYPDAFNALVHTPKYGTWLCSTPEVLVQGGFDVWNTMALAGTRPAGTPGPWDAKNVAEQDMVERHIAGVLRGYLAAPLSAKTLTAGTVEHLCTPFGFRMPLRELAGLLKEMAPTPAVAGSPVVAAVRHMAACPDVDRALYAGYMGPYAAEYTSLYVTLRCMRLYPGAGFCRLYAGGGLLPDSEEESEWQETLAKLRTMQEVISQTGR